MRRLLEVVLCKKTRRGSSYNIVERSLSVSPAPARPVLKHTVGVSPWLWPVVHHDLSGPPRTIFMPPSPTSGLATPVKNRSAPRSSVPDCRSTRCPSSSKMEKEASKTLGRSSPEDSTCQREGRG